MNRERLADRLAEEYDAPPGACRAVARAAGDLADSGRYRSNTGVELGADLVVDELSDAPDDHDLVERWNWWIGSLGLAFGGYTEFQVHQWDGADR